MRYSVEYTSSVGSRVGSERSSCRITTTALDSRKMTTITGPNTTAIMIGSRPHPSPKFSNATGRNAGRNNSSHIALRNWRGSL